MRAKFESETIAAAHSSGSAPVYLYSNDVRAVQVGKDHIWANIHASHSIYRCDYTAFCRKCGSVSSTYGASKLREPCSIKHRLTTYHKNLLKKMHAGRCPYNDHWKSGLARDNRWPPCELHILVRDVNLHHTNCDCETCRPGSGQGHTEDDIWNDSVDDPRANYTEAYNRGIDPENRLGAVACPTISQAERTKLLRELLDLENEGATVAWPSREDRAYAIACGKSEVTAIIAADMQDAEHKPSTAPEGIDLILQASPRTEIASSGQAGSGNDRISTAPEGLNVPKAAMIT